MSTMIRYFVLFLALSFCAQACYIPEPEDLEYVVKKPLKLIPKNDLPEQWLWNDVNGTNYLTMMRNQFIPRYCGSCWSFGSTSALADRIKIMRNAQWPDYELAPQILLSCAQRSSGCSGGSSGTAYEYIYRWNISHESCSNYQARGWKNGLNCSAEVKCETCDSHGVCKVSDSYPIFGIEEYGPVHGEAAMMNELYQRGPLSCAMDSKPLANYTGGIFNSSTGGEVLNHVVSIVGYGVENEVPFWLVRNTHGSFWGEKGFFRIIRGTNNLGIEKSCWWAVPRDTWTHNVRNTSNNSFPHVQDNDSKNVIDKRFLRKEMKYPESWDWRNISGMNYLSWTRNQKNCSSGWAEATTSALADRINIARNSTFPPLALSVQALINCGVGSCEAGNPTAVHEYALSHGIPEDSCQNYLAQDPPTATCDPLQVCKICAGPPPPAGEDWPQNCSAIAEYRNWTISAHGTISGVDQMKAAIYNDGPISCSIQATDRFDNYNGGIFSQVLLVPQPNHVVSLVGWGVGIDGSEYWIGRNSRGISWGEQGFFRILMGGSNLGIEKNCVWATPIVHSEDSQIYKKSKFEYIDL